MNGQPKVSYAADARFKRGLCAFFKYRDPGMSESTGGKVQAHVIRAVPDSFSGKPHLHHTSFQLVYVLKGWIEFEYEGKGIVRLEAGSSVYQPPAVSHREVAHSDDVEMLEIVMPADFRTEEVPAVDG